MLYLNPETNKLEINKNLYFYDCHSNLSYWFRMIEKNFGYKKRILAFKLLKQNFKQKTGREYNFLIDFCRYENDIKITKDICDEIYMNFVLNI